MEGFKHKGALIRGETEKGFYDPLETKVNFAVRMKNPWILLIAGSSFVLLKVTCSSYGINRIGQAVQDLH